jgi:hypothetical protein
MPIVYGHPIEILALERGRHEGTPVALLTFRPDPTQCLDRATIMFTAEQSVRIRNTLDRFLCDPESWLYTPPEEQARLRDTEE